MNDKQLNFFSENTIFVHGEFDNTIITNIIPVVYSLIARESNKKDGKIKISINSNGGSSHILYSLISVLEQAKSKGIIIETVVEYRAYSCASILAIAGTKGHRFIAPLGMHLVHFGHIGSVQGNTETNFDRTAKYVKNIKNRDKEIYKYYTNLTTKQINTLYEQDSAFLYADECIKYGLADKILGDEKMIKPVSLNLL